jgi:short-subunit dehydrogenase
MATPFSGKLALVTGASRGIGAATAEALGRAGAHVILTARSAGGLEEVEERIHQAGGSATIAPLDLAENDSIARLRRSRGAGRRSTSSSSMPRCSERWRPFPRSTPRNSRGC